MTYHENNKYDNLYIANINYSDKIERTKIIVFRYRVDKGSKTCVFEEIRGTFIDNSKTFVPTERPEVRWYFHNSIEGRLTHERIWYKINNKTEEEINIFRKEAIERLIESKKSYRHRLENSIKKIDNDLIILEKYKSKFN